jgi:RND family efflux transporter MFP subunit
MIALFSPRSPLQSVLCTVGALLFAALMVWFMWRHYLYTPWTRDGRINAEVVDVAPEVADNVVAILVNDNQRVKKGDVLVQIDPARYRLALDQAIATVANRQQIMAERQFESHRRVGLLASAAISLEEKQTSDASAAEAQSDCDAAVAQRDMAQLNLDRTTIRSTVNGYVTNLHLRVGDYANPGKPILSILDSDSYWVAAYMEETKLPCIHEGDRAIIKLMGPVPDIQGYVDSVSSGILDDNQSNFAGFANVNPIFTWVRLAQRIPVRIHMDQIPSGVRIAAGQTCTVIIRPGRGSN